MKFKKKTHTEKIIKVAKKGTEEWHIQESEIEIK